MMSDLEPLLTFTARHITSPVLLCKKTVITKVCVSAEETDAYINRVACDARLLVIYF
jgi:hypothetical protein